MVGVYIGRPLPRKMGGYVDVNVSIFQVHCEKTVIGANLYEDLFDS